ALLVYPAYAADASYRSGHEARMRAPGSRVWTDEAMRRPRRKPGPLHWLELPRTRVPPRRAAPAAGTPSGQAGAIVFAGVHGGDAEAGHHALEEAAVDARDLRGARDVAVRLRQETAEVHRLEALGPRLTRVLQGQVQRDERLQRRRNLGRRDRGRVP